MAPRNYNLDCLHGQAVQRQTQQHGAQAVWISKAEGQAEQQEYPDMLEAMPDRGHRTMRRRHDVQQRDADAQTPRRYSAIGLHRYTRSLSEAGTTSLTDLAVTGPPLRGTANTDM